MGTNMGVPASPSGLRPFGAEPQDASQAEPLVPNARRNGFWSFRFWGDDIACERRYVRGLFEAHGFSVGRRQRGALTGVMFGDFDIQKWRNLRPDDQHALHGTINEDWLPITASFPSGLPDQIDDALLALSNEDFARRQASVDRSPEGGNHEDGCHAKHESAVAASETPNLSPQGHSHE